MISRNIGVNSIDATWRSFLKAVAFDAVLKCFSFHDAFHRNEIKFNGVP